MQRRPHHHRPTELDLCTGCGNLALALAHYALNARVLGGDFCIKLRAQIDLVACSPPYVSSRKVADLPMEVQRPEPRPRVAFDGGPLGVDVLHRVLRDSPAYLRPGGWLVSEVGRGQGPSVVQRLRGRSAPNLASASAFEPAMSAVDAAGDIRVVMARRAFRSAPAPAPAHQRLQIKPR